MKKIYGWSELTLTSNRIETWRDPPKHDVSPSGIVLFHFSQYGYPIEGRWFTSFEQARQAAMRHWRKLAAAAKDACDVISESFPDGACEECEQEACVCCGNCFLHPCECCPVCDGTGTQTDRVCPDCGGGGGRDVSVDALAGI